uniref:Trans-1,2-dihydrobenzene-1,2-diol dehydrogenase n=1 Tax=Astatotilapia calliptera TaxID=8154 RepID=A0AAX7V5L7_ASTCA
MATRWGLCGAGKISHDFSVAIKTLPPGDHRIAVIASRSIDRAKDFAQKHCIPKAYGSYEELANNPKIDIVYLGMLHTEHWRVGMLFLKAGKNVLCEKPFAMNSRKVKDLVATAKKNHVFLMVVSFALRTLANSSGNLRVSFYNLPQHWVEELCWMYCLQFVLMVFNGERPESIQATGVLLDSGVDESVVVTMKFSRKRMALCAFSIAARLPNDAVIAGTKGPLKYVLGPMHCPTKLVVNDKETEYPLPEPCLPLNFTNSAGLRYEAGEVRQRLLKGLKESKQMPLADSVLLSEIMAEIRKQVGVVFNQDSQ